MRFLRRRSSAKPERRYVRVPTENGVPADLPPWARDELVSRRLEMSDLRREVVALKHELRVRELFGGPDAS